MRADRDPDKLTSAAGRLRSARRDAADALGPTYHDFRLLGLPTPQLPGIFEPNQRAKAPVIIMYLAQAIARLRLRGATDVSVVELFCADAYYAMTALGLGATRAVGIDNDRDGHLTDARLIREALDMQNLELRQQSVEELGSDEHFSVVLNVGGLYHVSDPEAVLDRSYRLASDFLIVQTVVSLATNDPDYFEAPAPGQPWGNRYSRASFERTIARRGWNVLDQAFNELTGNARSEDRGSLYFLVATGRGE